MSAGKGGEKETKPKTKTTQTKTPPPKPESCPGGLVAGNRWRRAGPGPLRAPVPRSRGGRRPRGSAAPAPPNRIGFGEGKPSEERSRPTGEAETWSLPAAPAISRPARLSPFLLPGGGGGGIAIFRGISRAPQGPELRPRTCRCRSGLGSGAAASTGTEEGWVPPLRLGRGAGERLQSCEGPTPGSWKTGGF